MPSVIAPLSSPERAILQLLEDGIPAIAANPAGRAGGDPPRVVDEIYFEVSLVPGGSSDRHGADFLVDIDVYADDYSAAQSGAFDAEALMLGYPHVVEVGGQKVILDSVEQNPGPEERPWADDSIYRIGATYVISVRRR